MKKYLRLLTALSALAVLGPAGFSSTAAGEEPPCYECHDALPAVAHPHDPAESGDCTACHEDHGDAEELRLVEEGSALCYQCHDEFGGTGSIHPPVDEGECTECHNPHGSEHGSLLVATGGELCYNCHDAMNEGASVHPPVDEGECTECHSPHSSEHGSLLVAAQNELCFNCHEEHGFKDPVEHAALDEGCTACHQPHSSTHEKLLAGNLSMERLELFKEEQGELCFTCHDVEAFTAKKSEETNFRHGDMNLHAHHLSGGAKPNKYGLTKKKAGQTCVACHLPHSSVQDRLVRTEFECKGIFCYTMRFRTNEFGGTCVVGCHKPKTYSRTATGEASTAGAGTAASSVKPGTP